LTKANKLLRIKKRRKDVNLALKKLNQGN